MSACTRGVEDTEIVSGVISEGKALGYEYSISKGQDSLSWRIGYKGESMAIKESTNNEDDLGNFMTAVNDSSVYLVKLIIALSYIVIVTITTLILYKKNRKLLKNSIGVIILVAIIAMYISVDTSFDLNKTLKDTQYYYLLLTG